jgi:hypothetical protein
MKCPLAAICPSKFRLCLHKSRSTLSSGLSQVELYNLWEERRLSLNVSPLLPLPGAPPRPPLSARAHLLCSLTDPLPLRVPPSSLLSSLPSLSIPPALSAPLSTIFPRLRHTIRYSSQTHVNNPRDEQTFARARAASTAASSRFPRRASSRRPSPRACASARTAPRSSRAVHSLPGGVGVIRVVTAFLTRAKLSVLTVCDGTTVPKLSAIRCYHAIRCSMET